MRSRLADQNKVLTDQVNTQRSIVKKNQELLKEAQKLDASNKKLMEEKEEAGDGKRGPGKAADGLEGFAERDADGSGL